MAALKHGRRYVPRPTLSVERLEGRCTPAGLFVELESGNMVAEPVEPTNPDVDLAIVAEEPPAESADPTGWEEGMYILEPEGPFDGAGEDWTDAFPWEGDVPSDDFASLLHEVQDIAISGNEEISGETTVEILSFPSSEIPGEENDANPPATIHGELNVLPPPRPTRRPSILIVPPTRPPAEALAPMVPPLNVAPVPQAPLSNIALAAGPVRYVFSDSQFASTTMSESLSSPAPALEEKMPYPKMPPGCRIEPEADVQDVREQAHDERSVTLTAIAAATDAPSTGGNGAALLGAAGMAGLYKRKRSRRSKRRRSES